MRLFTRIASLWATLFRKARLHRELDDEIRAAVDTLAARYVAAGADAADARRAALAAVAGPGGVVRVKEDVLDARIGAGLDSLLFDLRYAWRGLRKAPGLTAVIVVTLALGIGANTAIFSIVHAMLLAPLPYRDADRLVFVWLNRTQVGYPRGPMSGPDFGDLRTGSQTIASLGGIWASSAIALTGDGPPEQLRAAFVTTNFFQVLGAEAALGRTFRAEDSARGADPTILIGWDLFRRRFGGDASVVGRRIRIDDRPVTVIGVLPRGFRLLLPSDASVPDHLQAFTPFWPDLETGPRRNLFLRVIGRMRPGVTVAQARADIDAVGARVTRQLGNTRAFTTVGLQDDGVREIRGALVALFAGVGILLAIACVNVASLLIARAAARARETALRLALGASRGRLLRQALVEGLLLTALGIAAGVFAGYAALRMLLAIAPDSLSRIAASRIDVPVLTFTLVIAAAWGLLFSLAPATELLSADACGSLRSSADASRVWRRRDARGALRGHYGVGRYRTRGALVVAQIALSLVLLVSAGLLVRAFVAVARVDPGFRADRHLTFRLAIPPRYETTEAFNLFAAELQRRLAAIPGVGGVGAFSHLPYDDLPNWGLPYSLDAPIAPDAPMADSRAISAGLFETLGVRLVEGRFFDARDADPRNPVVIVDDMLARELWPGRSALGQRLVLNVGSKNVRVVGVVRHLKLRSLVDNLSPQVFVPWPIAQRNPIAYVVRTADQAIAPSALAPAVAAAVASLDPRLPVYDVRPLAAYVESARSTRRFTMVLAAAFASCALLLTCVGVYGVLAYGVAHRRREFGVRRALGATTRQVMAHVLREGIAFAVAGCAAGLAGAVVASRLLQSQLYVVHPRDPITYAIAVGAILVGGAVACGIPAYRATRVSPMDALRTE